LNNSHKWHHVLIPEVFIIAGSGVHREHQKQNEQQKRCCIYQNHVVGVLPGMSTS
jgi:hypothetical protein